MDPHSVLQTATCVVHRNHLTSHQEATRRRAKLKLETLPPCGAQYCTVVPGLSNLCVTFESEPPTMLEKHVFKKSWLVEMHILQKVCDFFAHPLLTSVCSRCRVDWTVILHQRPMYPGPRSTRLQILQSRGFQRWEFGALKSWRTA